jgi:hypothetical protein
MSRNDLQNQILQSNRSKKNLSLVHGQQIINSPHGNYNLQSSQDAKLKNYYDMLEKNRQKSLEKFQSDISKIYVMPNSPKPQELGIP